MHGWLTAEEAGRFFGIGNDIEELERIVVEFDIEVDMDSEGSVTRVSTDGLREALFEEHKRKVGHRPDDPVHVKKQQTLLRNRENAAKRRRAEKRAKLKARVAARKRRGKTPAKLDPRKKPPKT